MKKNLTTYDLEELKKKRNTLRIITTIVFVLVLYEIWRYFDTKTLGFSQLIGILLLIALVKYFMQFKEINVEIKSRE